MDWAQNAYDIRHFAASISPDNPASLRIIQRLGFTKVGEGIDDVDGIEHVFLRIAG
jgi:RimJ/RimL family protein N-acetyltransferase